MAYWLGFLFADGCVHKQVSGYITTLGLKCTDHSHVEKYKKALQSSYHLGLYKNGAHCKALHVICDNSLAMDLIGLGCIPRKSLTLQWPNNIPDEYVPHFVRGYFDGDGCIHFNKSKRGLEVDILGTRNFITYLQSHIKEKVFSDSRVKGAIFDRKNITVIRYGGVLSP
eukprot:38868_1